MKRLQNIKNIVSNYKHGLIVLFYGIIYLIWFTALERNVTHNYNIVYSRLDDFIPFNELFIIPYTLWFLYIIITIAYLLLTSKKDFYKCCAYLFIGMTICLIIYTIWPNGHRLRVNLDLLGRDNLWISMISKIYSVDTSTNVFPSIHVFNSIGAMIAIRKNEKLRNIAWLQAVTFILTISICLSTVFLKQHSVLDIFGAIALNIIMYFIVYIPDWGKELQKEKQAFSKAS